MTSVEWDQTQINLLSLILKGSENYLSMEIAFSSYEGEKLGDFLKEYGQIFEILL